MSDGLVPHGTRYLLITCHHPKDQQFAGIARACSLLSRKDGVHHLNWENQNLDLRRRKTLRGVLISGHGAVSYPRVSDRHRRRLHPGDLDLPPEVPFYLLACHQGRRALRLRWTQETGGLAFGCEGETESLLSTLLLLGLLDHGLATLHRWYRRWLQANNRLRPHFTFMREMYRAKRRNWTAALHAIQSTVDLGPFEDILSLAISRHQMLSGLGPEEPRSLPRRVSTGDPRRTAYADRSSLRTPAMSRRGGPSRHG